MKNITSTLLISVICVSPLNGQTQRMSFVRDLVLGSIEDRPDAFSAITSVGEGRNGDVFVLDGQERVVKVFNAAGRLLRTIGRVGAGPGEFQTPVFLGTTADTLWVIDHALGRATFFTLDGSAAKGTASIRSQWNGAPLQPVGLLDDGSLLAALRQHTGLSLAADPILRVSRNGMIVDTMAWISVRNSKLRIANTRSPALGLSAQQPLADGPLYTLLPNGKGIAVVERWAADNDTAGVFTVTWIGSRGDTARVGRFRYKPVAISRAYSDSLVEHWTQIVLNARGPGISDRNEARRRVRDVLYIPRSHMPIDRVVAASDGSLWLRRPGLSAAREWVIIGPNGALQATVMAPAGVVAAAPGHIWVMELDSLDVPYLVRYRAGR